MGEEKLLVHDVFENWQQYYKTTFEDNEFLKKDITSRRFNQYVKMFGAFEDVVLKVGFILPFLINIIYEEDDPKVFPKVMPLWKLLENGYDCNQFIRDVKSNGQDLMDFVSGYAEYLEKIVNKPGYTKEKLNEMLTTSCTPNENKDLLRIIGFSGVPVENILLMSRRMQNCTSFNIFDPDDYCFLLALKYIDVYHRYIKIDGEMRNREWLYLKAKEIYKETIVSLESDEEYEDMKNSVSIKGSEVLLKHIGNKRGDDFDVMKDLRKNISLYKRIKEEHKPSFEKMKETLWQDIKGHIYSYERAAVHKIRPIWTTLRFYFKGQPVEIPAGTRVIAYHPSDYFFEFTTSRFDYALDANGQYADVVAYSYDVSGNIENGRKIICISWSLEQIVDVSAPFEVYVGSVPVRLVRNEFESENQNSRYFFEFEGEKYRTDEVKLPRKFSYYADVVGGLRSKQLSLNQADGDSIIMCGDANAQVALDADMDIDVNGTKGKFVVASKDKLDIRKYSVFFVDDEYYYRTFNDIRDAVIETYAVPCEDDCWKKGIQSEMSIFAREVEMASMVQIDNYELIRHELLGLNGNLKLDQAVKDGYYDGLELLLWSWNLPYDIKMTGKFGRTQLLVLAFWRYVINNENLDYDEFLREIDELNHLRDDEKIDLDNHKVQLLAFLIKCIDRDEIPESYARLHQLSLYQLFQKQLILKKTIRGDKEHERV